MGRPNAIPALLALSGKDHLGAVELADEIGGYRNGGIKIARHLEQHDLATVRVVGKKAGRDVYEIRLTRKGKMWAQVLRRLDKVS